VVARAGQALTHSHVHRHIRPAPLAQAPHHAWTPASRPRSKSVAHARSYTDDVEFSAEDATRSDLDFLCRVVEAVIDAGATTINLPDTVGYATPDEIGEFFRTVMTRVPNAHRAVFSAHCHDDLGLAVANTLAAIQRGRAAGGVHRQRHRRTRRQRLARGNRDGDARAPGPPAGLCGHRHAAALSIQPDALGNHRRERVQANKAIVGRNAFAHEAGIHQDGMLKDRRTYEIMRPDDVGVPATTLVLGKHSGRHAVQKRCEQLGLTLSRQDLDLVYRKW
jgi:2-isopropylmalate synthase